MTSIFFLAALGLASLLALLWVLRPLWHKGVESGPSKGKATLAGDEAARLAVYRDRKREIEREVLSGRVRAEEAERLQNELVSDVAMQFTGEQTPSAVTRRPLAASLLGLMALLIGAAAYLAVGAPQLTDPEFVKGIAQRASQSNPNQPTTGNVPNIVVNPQGPEDWLVNAVAYKGQGKLQESAQAFEQYLKMSPSDKPDVARVLAEYAETLALLNNSDFSGKPTALLEQALALDPNEQKSLAMMGAAMFRAGKLAEARKHLARLIAQMPADSVQAQQLRPVLDRIDQQLKASGEAPQAASPPLNGSGVNATSGPLLTGKLKLSDAALATLAQTKVLFISARPVGGGMPLAAIKLEGDAIAQTLSNGFSLNDAQSLNPQMPLSKAKEVNLEAYLSRSGTAGKQAGDWFGRLEGLVPGQAGSMKLELSISQQHQP